MDLFEIVMKYVDASEEVKSKIDFILKECLPTFVSPVEASDTDQQSA